MQKWSKQFWIDLAERTGATFLGALLTVLTVEGLASLTPELAVAILGVPTATSLVKGLLANLANAESGASMVPSPPAPAVDAAPEYVPRHKRDEGGRYDVFAAVCIVLLVLILVAIASPLL